MADERTTTHSSPPLTDDTFTFDAALDAGLAAAFTSDLTPGGWSQPPRLRDDPPDSSPILLPGSSEIPKADSGRYQYLGEIARGGMGVVLRGRDPDLGRDLAVKVLRTEFLGRPSSEQRFVEEAQVNGQLQHPGVVPVYELGRFADGRPFFTMKLVKGHTLAELLAKRPDPSHNRGQFLQDFLRVCEAVGFAHSRGVIHRDLKPSNIMVGYHGEVQVMDWGLAKVMRGAGCGVRNEHQEPSSIPHSEIRVPHSEKTQAGSVLGTLAYMSPEQAGGEIDKLDERADVFGLGAVLCVILTGEPPYAGPSSEAVRLKAVRGELTDAFARLDGCGAEPGYVDLCKGCLNPNRDARPRTAGDVARAVAGLFNAAQERARAAEVAQAAAEARTREERKRHRVQVGLVLALALAAGLVGFGAWWQDQQVTRRAAEQEAARAAARQKLESALDRAEAAFREDQLPAAGTALDLAGELLDSADAPDLRGRYEELRADRVLAAELDRVWARANAILSDQLPTADRRGDRYIGRLRFDEAAARAAYPAAFAARGWAVESADPGELVARVAHSPIRERVVASLDDWLPVAAPADRLRLCDLLTRIDPDPARTAVRRAHTEPGALRSLFATVPGQSALRVAARAAISAEVPDAHALAVLRVAAGRHSDDFRTQYDAGLRELRSNPAAAVGYFRAALALRPGDAAVNSSLGFALHTGRNPREAVPHYLRALEADPDYATGYINLADVIKMGADPAPAVAHFEREVARHPDRAMAYFGLGMALRESHPQRAAAAFRRSIELNGNFAPAHNYLGYVLNRRQDLDERIRCYRRAIELDPEFAFPHFNLGGMLRSKGDLPGAIAAYREALRHFPTHTWSHMALGESLAAQDDLRGAAAHLKRAVEIDPYLIPAYPRLTQVLVRDGRPAEGFRILSAVARLHPDVADDPRSTVRYNAACFAMACATGAGTDAPPPAERPGYRRQGFELLALDLGQLRRLATTQRANVHQVVQHWLADADLAPVRDRAALEQLPPDERAGWERLWVEVRALRDATAPSERAPAPRHAR